MDTYSLVKTLHVIGSTILFGTGIGIAFFMFRSHFTDDIHEKLYAARNTVLADYIFTFPAVIIQPITGFWLVSQSAYEWNETWLVITYGLYVLAGLCWLPVVWIQIQLKKMLQSAAVEDKPLPNRYNKLFRLWFLLGWPAFLGLIVVFYMMVTRPV
ncbi:MAG: DUF2269 family protein [Kordiimonas sp.]